MGGPLRRSVAVTEWESLGVGTAVVRALETDE